ncbi:Ig-like domain-containing protein, partial [Neobacillus drentensis]|uniref:Ig-like domain-containing protein n=1 Tax=Neobacillus drentensis TaxID=220684 RepID=UPI002FFFAACC
GQAEAGSKVEILVNGSVVGTGHADDSREFIVSIPVQKAGTELFIRSTDLAGNVGEALSVVVRDVTSPEKPIVREVSNKDSVVSGEAEAGAKIEVLSNGGVLGTATAGADGKFVVTIMVQAAGTELEVTATDSQGNKSLATKMVVKDRIAPKAPVVNQVTDEEFVIKGTAEPGSLISVKYHGSVLGTGTAGKDGGFAVEIPVPGSLGTEFTVSAKDESGNESEETKYIVVSSKKGWVKKGIYWYYYDLKTGLPVTGWLLYSKKWYYLGENGLMKTGWLLDKNRWYYLDGSGVMKTGWLKSGSKWYYLDGNSGVMRTGWLKSGYSWYYLDRSGAMKTGWLKDGSAWYYLDSGGVMKTGWVTIAGKRYYFNTKGVWVK